jgi:hypothetical protein
MNDIAADFAIQIGFQRASSDPTRVFRAMIGLIDACQYLDRELAHTIDVSLTPVLILEDIEAGSIKTWLRAIIESTDDNALKSGDWKKVVGIYLYKAKYATIRFLDKKTQISSRAEFGQLEAEIFALAQVLT